MPGPVSDSYEGPDDKIPLPPRWAYPHLNDEEYEQMCEAVGAPWHCKACGRVMDYDGKQWECLSCR